MAAADRVRAIHGEVTQASELPTSWRGPASAAFATLGDELGPELRRTAGSLRTAAGALSMLAAELEAAQETARRAEALLSEILASPLDAGWMAPTVPGPLRVVRMCDKARDRARLAWARANASFREAAGQLPQLPSLVPGRSGHGHDQATEHVLAALLLPLVLRDDPDHVCEVSTASIRASAIAWFVRTPT